MREGMRATPVENNAPETCPVAYRDTMSECPLYAAQCMAVSWWTRLSNAADTLSFSRFD